MGNVNEHCASSVPVVLVGNIVGKNTNRKVYYEESKVFASEHRNRIKSVIETNARTGENVDMAMVSIVIHGVASIYGHMNLMNVEMAMVSIVIHVLASMGRQM